MKNQVHRNLWIVVLPGPHVDCRIEDALGVVPAERVIVVATDEAGVQLPDVEAAVRRLVQPAYRGSAPALYGALLDIAGLDSGATVAVLPGSMSFDSTSRIMSHVRRAEWAVMRRPELPVLLGVRPTSVNLSFGWIEAGDPISGLETLGVRAVRRFVEAPSWSLAAALYSRHTALLNTAVMVADVGRLIALGRVYLPDVLAALIDDAWAAMPERSVSRSLLERGEPLAVVAVPDVIRRTAPVVERVNTEERWALAA